MNENKLTLTRTKFENLLKKDLITTNFLGLKVFTVLEKNLDEIRKFNQEDEFGTKYKVIENKSFEQILKLTYESKEDNILFDEENETCYPDRLQSKKKEVFYILKILNTNRIVFLKKTFWY